ncbi:hypothetical protein GCM10011371_08910 [Novosphingobium marinum]|uniref:DUF3445 domain-containing protein n=1 Tax=Novosphingobium marinum TaxID=1514948 RepID=A0A7Z0BUR5_9SPHN|nr:DUF3445 domain-containing protein [Novosphingobium marinum]NYH94580.1 hypothetical protein [Novosphingobium marinum]GGC23421.1 hypothetical protein GCM10011371_08910 [Novosphingobium marinum]
MTLGFGAAALLPRARGGGVLRMGLSRLSEEGWLDPTPDLSVRAGHFDEHPDSVEVRPEGEDAAREVAELLGVAGGLEDAARSVWEDLCVLTRDAGGTYRLTGGAVAFPTDWRLGDKMGLTLPEVHAPIQGYAEQLAAGVDRFIENLRPGEIWGRANWFVVASDNLRYLPADDPAERFVHVTPANAGDALFLRCERQTLRRLPATGAVLFTIGVYRCPLRDLDDAALNRICDAFASLIEGEGDRRGVPHYTEALRGHAAARSGPARANREAIS